MGTATTKCFAPAIQSLYRRQAKLGVIRRIPLIFLLVILLLPSTCWAAGRFTLLPSMVLLGEWTDNLLLTPEDSEDEKLADYSITGVPGLRLRYDSYRTEAFIGVAAGFRHYFEYDEYDGLPEYYQGGIGWSYWLNPVLRLTLIDELTFYTDPRDQPFADQADVDSLRTESIANRVGASLLYNVTRLSALETGYSFATAEFEEDTLDDTVEHLAFISWSRQLSEAYRFFVFYNYTRALFSTHYDFLRRFWDQDYSMRPTFPTALRNETDFDTHIPGVGLRYQATPSLSFEARSGIVMPCYLRNEAYQLDDVDWYQRIEVVKLFWRIQTMASYTRTIAPAHGLAGAVLTQTVAGRIDERWTRQFETIQETAYSNYQQDAADIDAVRVGAGANYYFFHWLGMGVAYSFLNQVGLFEEGGDQELYAHRVTLRLALTTPRPDWLSF